MGNDNQRYLIIGSGRSGSSLLAAILADAGADFGMAGVASWDSSKGGAYEHPKLHAAYRWYSRANKIAKSMWPDLLGRRFCELQVEMNLRDALGKARFGKYGAAIWLVHTIRKLGYKPRIIASFRSFTEFAASRHLRFGWNLQTIANTYVDIYSTALLQLSIFGGCAISYEDVTNPKETKWAKALAQVAGLDTDQILASRDKRIDPARAKQWPELFMKVVDPRVAMLYEAMVALKGKVIDSNYF